MLRENILVACMSAQRFFVRHFQFSDPHLYLLFQLKWKKNLVIMLTKAEIEVTQN